MNLEENSYCRLCAEVKPCDKVVNLLQNDGDREEVVEKLRRLNAAVDFSTEILPQTVCFVCITSLDTAFHFVISIKKAQNTLSSILLGNRIKIESESDADCASDEGSSIDEISAADVSNVLLEKQTKIESEESESDADCAVNEGCSIDEISAADVPKELQNEIKEIVFLETMECVENIIELDQKFKPIECTSVSEPTQKISNLPPRPIPQSTDNRTWEDYRWTCSHCEHQFSTVQELITHSMQDHNVCNAYRCMDCPGRPLCLKRFLLHVRRHHKNLKVSCYNCYETLPSMIKCTQHEKGHSKTEYVCRGCNSSFENSIELKKHTDTFYFRVKSRPLPDMANENLTCLLCQKRCRTKITLQNHLLTHTERKKNHTCEICGMAFYAKGTMLVHVSTVHSNSRKYQCDICKATFKSRSMIRNHMSLHDKRRSYVCEHCGKGFRLKKYLRLHSVIHKDVKPHVCTFCNKRFLRKQALNLHLRQHTGVKPYKCAICQRDFTNIPNYSKHMKRRHKADTHTC